VLHQERKISKEKKLIIMIMTSRLRSVMEKNRSQMMMKRREMMAPKI
jgi:hypothetical protein